MSSTSKQTKSTRPGLPYFRRNPAGGELGLLFLAAVLSLVGGAHSVWAQSSAVAESQTPSGSIRGVVVDESGGAIEAAEVTLTNGDGRSQKASTAEDGGFRFSEVAAGKTVIRVTAPDFAPQALNKVVVQAGREQELEIQLRIATRKEEVTVLSTNRMTSGALFRGDSMILDEDAIKMLPDGPNLQNLLRAMALRTSGLHGPELRVNGFTGNRTPPKSAIREIRINNNPFSPEYAQHGLGRIEILTKPGGDKVHGQLHMAFGDEALNSRNPFASERAPFQRRTYSGNVSGPFVKNKFGYFVDFARDEGDGNAIVNATIPNEGFTAITPYNVVVARPERGWDFTARTDFQILPKHTAIVQYDDSWKRFRNSAIGELNLPSRAQTMTNHTRSVQFTETAVLSPTVINETKVQFRREQIARFGDNSTPEIRVPGAFVGGGAELGDTFDHGNRLYVDNSTAAQIGDHYVRVGGQLQYQRLLVSSDRNFGGAYTFGGGLAPQLDAEGEIVYGEDGQPVLTPITNIESYRRTLLFSEMGLSSEAIRERGGGPVQFSMSAGRPETALDQYEIAAYVQDDWRLHPKFMLSPGLRLERQNNISQNLNFAPRLGFAWNAGPGADPKTVIRGGVGMFYDRIDHRIVLRSRQLDGMRQLQYITDDVAALDLFPNAPPLDLLQGSAVSRSIVQLAPQIRPSYTMHASLSVERQISKTLSLAATYSDVRTVRLLRSRNINAPLPGTYDPSAPEEAVRPYPGEGNIFAYESTGFFNSRQMLLNLTYYQGERASYWVSYSYNDSHADAEDADTFPASAYNLRQDYGRSSLNSLHTIYWGGWMSIPWKIEVMPLGVWRTGIPFNVTTGSDNNGDSLFTDRPAFATDPNAPGVVVNRYGMFNLNPAPGVPLIPRNYLFGPSFFIANLQLRRTFQIPEHGSIVLSVQGQNVFNTTNPGAPIGNLASPLFGVSPSSAGDWGLGSNQAGNRRLILTITYNF